MTLQDAHFWTGPAGQKRKMSVDSVSCLHLGSAMAAHANKCDKMSPAGREQLGGGGGEGGGRLGRGRGRLRGGGLRRRAEDARRPGRRGALTLTLSLDANPNPSPNHEVRAV